MCPGMVCTFIPRALRHPQPDQDLYSQSHPKAQLAHGGTPTVKTRLYFETTYHRLASKHWTMVGLPPPTSLLLHHQVHRSLQQPILTSFRCLARLPPSLQIKIPCNISYIDSLSYQKKTRSQ
ncbi:hypothetical protein ARMGADRAFT_590776 [Armillaria gallica]|uniref:Uncharacterized protein n=1 Tax=Armillaria gallica TaxID=47427 RepID=A0A2H3EHU6_ARMGA|nr:hypothetical protein ARMGADRAFT_590776 [Armillaria gallica]